MTRRIYPEVHFPMEASLRWSGAVFTKVKHRIAVIWHTVISFVSYHQCGEARITMLPLRLTTRTFTRMRHTPQLGGSSPNAPSHQNSMLQGRGTHHNLIGGSRQYPASHQNSEIATRSRKLPKLRDNNNRLGHSKYPRGQALGHFKNPRVTSFSTSTSTNHRGELKPMQLMQWARTQVLKSFTLKFQQGNKCLWGNKRGRTKEINK